MENKKQAELVSKNSKIVVPDTNDKKYQKTALFIIGGFIAIFVIWGGFAKLSSAVAAPGKVSVALNHKTLQHLEGGIVKEIFVQDGDHVIAGQTLMTLENAKAKSELGAVESQYLELLAMEARLTAERDDKSQIKFDPELTAKGNEALKQTLIKNQTYEFGARRGQLNQELTVYSERKAQLKQQIDGLKSVIAAKEDLLKSYKEEVKEWTALYQEQLIDKMRLRDVTREKTRLEGDIASQKADLAKASVQIAEINAQMMARKGEVQKDIGSTLRDVQTKLSDYRARVTALRESLNRTEIKTPATGRVVGLSVHTVGGVVAPGKPILDIVPDGEHLVMSCRVEPTNISYIHKGLEAQVTFPSFSHIKSLNNLEGKVIDISADTLYDEASRMSYYEAKVELTKDAEAELIKHKLQLIPGMPADAMIITGERTFVEYLIKPIKDMFDKGMREQ